MIAECDSCGFKIELKKVEDKSIKREVYMCDVCLSTFVGNAYLYPEQYENSHVLRTLAWMTNAIIKAIKENKK